MNGRVPVPPDLERDGYTIVPALLTSDEVSAYLDACPPVPSAGLRDLFGAVPAFAPLARHPAVSAAVWRALGRPGFVTRAILFDKSPAANWALGFHQDVVIATEARHEVPGFGPWSVKAGIPHVRPPSEVLAGMLTVRIHLDPCPRDNGPLTVIPGSHDRGFLDDSAVQDLIARGPHVDCPVGAGDAVLMRPLLLHGSRKADKPRARRVIHLEFACDPLPPPLRWRSQPAGVRS